MHACSYQHKHRCTNAAIFDRTKRLDFYTLFSIYKYKDTILTFSFLFTFLPSFLPLSSPSVIHSKSFRKKKNRHHTFSRKSGCTVLTISVLKVCSVSPQPQDSKLISHKARVEFLCSWGSELLGSRVTIPSSYKQSTVLLFFFKLSPLNNLLTSNVRGSSSRRVRTH